MGLPKLVTPEFETVIPSSNTPVKFRPFLVKEEKVLMIAMEGGEERDIFNAGKQILSECIIKPRVDVDKLCSFDFEYLFLQLRAKSVGEEVEFKMTHKDSECKHFTNIKINIEDIKIDTSQIPNPQIKLTDTIGITMRFPSVVDLTSLNSQDTKDMFDLIMKCVVNVYDEETLYEDFTREEMSDFLDSLSQPQFEKIYSYIQSMPKLSHEIKWKCEQCGEEDSYVVEGLGSFFG